MKLFLLQIIIPIKRKFLVSILLLAFGSTFAQNGIIGTSFGANDWTTIDNFLAGAGSSRIFTATPNGTGPQYFRLVRNWSGNYTQFGPFGCVNTEWTNPGIVYGMSVCSNGAFFINCPNITDSYVFKTPNGGTAMDLLYFRIEGAVRGVAAVTQSPLAANVNECHATTVTATLDGALSAGQAVYMRYTKDGYATSTVVLLTGAETTYTGKIPSAFNTAGADVSYYLFTSGTTTPSGADADFYTINLNNNGGPNYSYRVGAGGATTYIPDDNFEQALINLGLDCSLDNYVFTSNISDVLLLDIRDRNITNLEGIEAFTNIQKLYCNNDDGSVANNNAITTLDVSTLTYLRYFYCQNNQITNLNISGLTKLEALDTSNNPFIDTILDVHLNPNLSYLVCQNNGLTDLNISGLTNLEKVIVWDNSLTAIDLRANPKISYLDCDENLFTSLDVSKFENLDQFYCTGNQLTSLDVRGLSNLADFVCTYNPSLRCILVDNVAAAEALQSAGNWAKDATATYSYCACALPTTTWNGAAWDNGVPISTQAAIIEGPYNNVLANISACSLTIKNGATVTIPSGYNVTLNAPLTVETGGSFTLSNNANLIQTNKNSINAGAINVNRNSSPLFRLDYTIWSSPVSGVQTLGGFSPVTSTNRFYEYNTATDLYNAVSATSTFDLAKGYLIRMPNTDPTSGYDAGTASIAYPGVFTGMPNNGNVSLTALTSDKYYAIGNPYPSTISANAFLSGNASGGTLYFWRKKNAGVGTAYATYNLVGATVTAAASGDGSAVPNGTIQVGQGFIVKTGLAATSLNFTNAMRETSPTSTQFFKTKNLAVKDRVWLNLTNSAGVFSQMLVAYVPDATQGVDAGIDGKYINDSPIALTSSINNEEYSIQGRPTFDPSDVVALNFKTNIASDYTIAIDHVDGLFLGNQEVYLLDNKTGTETNLKTGSYTFSAAVGVDNARFSLKYERTLGVNANVFNGDSITIHKTKGTLYVNSGSTAINNIKVFDIQGRLIAEQKNLKSNTATIKDLKATQQVLIVKITSQDNKVVSKKVLN